MTPPTTDTSREGVDFVKDVSESFGLQSPPKGVAFDRFDSPEPAFTFFENGRIKVSDKLSPEDTAKAAWDCLLGMIGGHNKVVAERDAALLREKALKDNTEELRQLRREFNAVKAERDALRDQLAAARNETLEEAARVVDIEYEMHKDYRNASLLCNNDEDAQCRLISMTTCASISAAIDALKDTTPAPLFVSSRSIQMDAPSEDWQEHADKASAIIRGSAQREVTVQEAARVLLANRWAGYGNSKAMQAMCNYVHDEQGRMPFPASFYDGVMQAGLRALAKEEQSDG